MKRAKVEFYEAKNGEWSWRLKAPNGEIIAVPGETFVTAKNAERSFTNLIKYTIEALSRHLEKE